MSKVRFLLDEHVNRAIQRQLRRWDILIHVLGRLHAAGGDREKAVQFLRDAAARFQQLGHAVRADRIAQQVGALRGAPPSGIAGEG